MKHKRAARIIERQYLHYKIRKNSKNENYQNEIYSEH